MEIVLVLAVVVLFVLACVATPQVGGEGERDMIERQMLGVPRHHL